jgi:hypothetical protein
MKVEKSEMCDLKYVCSRWQVIIFNKYVMNTHTKKSAVNIYSPTEAPDFIGGFTILLGDFSACAFIDIFLRFPRSDRV